MFISLLLPLPAFTRIRHRHWLLSSVSHTQTNRTTVLTLATWKCFAQQSCAFPLQMSRSTLSVSPVADFFTSDRRQQRFFPRMICQAVNAVRNTRPYINLNYQLSSVCKRLTTAAKALRRYLPAMLTNCIHNSMHNASTTCVNGI